MIDRLLPPLIGRHLQTGVGGAAAENQNEQLRQIPNLRHDQTLLAD
jgi:hypothetical protein